jgi:hypothetical protein
MICLSINEEAEPFCCPFVHHEHSNVKRSIMIYLNLLGMQAASEYFCVESRFLLRHNSFGDQSAGWPGMRLGL